MWVGNKTSLWPNKSVQTSSSGWAMTQSCYSVHIQMTVTMHLYMTWHCIHVLMRDERRKKERSKQRQTNKQGKATQHTQGSLFLEKMRLRWDSNPRHSIHRTERSTSWATEAAQLAGPKSHISYKYMFVCLTLLASFFLPSHLSFKNMYMYDHS